MSNSETNQQPSLHTQGQISAVSGAVSIVLLYLVNKHPEDAEKIRSLLTNMLEVAIKDSGIDNQGFLEGSKMQADIILRNLDAAIVPANAG